MSHSGEFAVRIARRRSEVMAFWCISPAVFLMIVTTFAPFSAVLALSFTDYEFGAIQMDWVGLTNFAKFLKDPAALRAVTNTLLFSGITVPLAVGLGLVLALLVNGRTKKVDAFTRCCCSFQSPPP